MARDVAAGCDRRQQARARGAAALRRSRPAAVRARGERANERGAPRRARGAAPAGRRRRRRSPPRRPPTHLSFWLQGQAPVESRRARSAANNDDERASASGRPAALTPPSCTEATTMTMQRDAEQQQRRGASCAASAADKLACSLACSLAQLRCAQATGAGADCTREGHGSDAITSFPTEGSGSPDSARNRLQPGMHAARNATRYPPRCRQLPHSERANIEPAGERRTFSMQACRKFESWAFGSSAWKDVAGGTGVQVECPSGSPGAAHSQNFGGCRGERVPQHHSRRLAPAHIALELCPLSQAHSCGTGPVYCVAYALSKAFDSGIPMPCDSS